MTLGWPPIVLEALLQPLDGPQMPLMGPWRGLGSHMGTYETHHEPKLAGCAKGDVTLFHP